MNLSFAALESTLPAASIARTLNLCLPWSRFLIVFGEVQGLNFLLANPHSKVESGSEELNLNLTLVLSVLFAAPLVILVWGAAVSGGVVSGGRGRSSTATPSAS